jgi:ribose/xylose/arabinose/galactoside ABC-type transport system permease subunit
MTGLTKTRHAFKHALATYGLLVLALVIECAVFQAISLRQEQAFLTLPSMVNVLNRATVYGILAVGMTFVIITGGIDLSVGSVLAFSGVVCAKVVFSADASVWTALCLGYAAALLVGLAVGATSSTLITWCGVPPFIATLALMSSLRGLAFIVAGGQSISSLPDAYTWLGWHRIGGVIPVNVLVMLSVFLLGGLLLNATRFGRHVRAIGGNEDSARLSGVRVARVKWGVYCMCAVLAALGGLVASSKLGSGVPKMGIGAELSVIAAVVVGGTSLSGGRGTIGGTFLGLLIIAVLETGLNWVGVETFGQQVTLGIAILAAVLLDQLTGSARLKPIVTALKGHT